MLRDHKILVTGLTGQIGHPIARFLARDNEVWGVARFSAEGSRERAEAIGVTTHVADLASGDLNGLPDDFTHLVHFAAWQGKALDHDWAIRANAEATGLVMNHCRRAAGALIASTNSVYRPHQDPMHRYVETDPLGDATAPHSPTYGVSKVSQEAVARAMARVLDLPTGGLPAYHGDWVAAGESVWLREPGPNAYSPIHEDDMARQVEALLEAASAPATIVNWCGDDVVTAEEWVALYGAHLGVEPKLARYELPGGQPGSAGDPTRRLSLTGPCTIDWRDGMVTTLDARVDSRNSASN